MYENKACCDEPCTTQAQGEIARIFHKVQESKCKLKDSISILEKRLNPILSNSKPTAENACEAMKIETDMGRMVNELLQELELFYHTIDNMIRRVEI